jgi:hypothetical protein
MMVSWKMSWREEGSVIPIIFPAVLVSLKIWAWRFKFKPYLETSMTRERYIFKRKCIKNLAQPLK